MKRFVLYLLVLTTCWSTAIASLQWNTHFSYANVEQIAVASKDVYALANGALFSINKQSEHFTTYDSDAGIQGSAICLIGYDQRHNQLLVFHTDGKIDVITNGRARYISDLYYKRMTASKQCHNITVVDDIAYLSMDFGILTFDLQKLEFRDTYYIGPEATEVVVQDVLLLKDSLYAKTPQGVYCASIHDHLVDFRYWTITTRMVPFDITKGKEATDDNGDKWQCAGEKGILRQMITGEDKYYLPKGPFVNIPYSLTAYDGRLYMLSGGRWALQYNNDGHVMYLEDGEWTNIAAKTITSRTGVTALDMMNVAIDPFDKSHYFVTSYGTGLYEFRDTVLLHHYLPSNSVLQSAVPQNPTMYTRICGATYDKDGRIWVQQSGVDPVLAIFGPDTTQHSLSIYHNQAPFINHTPGNELIMDVNNGDQKWMLYCRYQPGVMLLHDGGTPFDPSDDRFITRKSFIDQDYGAFEPEFFFTLAQAPDGDIWIGTSAGPVVISHNTDFFSSNQCHRLRIRLDDGSYLMESERVNTIAFDDLGCAWIGTQSSGIYVLSGNADSLIAHYTSANTKMPSNCILSMAYDQINHLMYVGTGGGLVSCKWVEQPTDVVDKSAAKLTYGIMKRWKTHFSYSEANYVVSLGSHVYASANGSLYAVDKTAQTITFFNQETGLNGSCISRMWGDTKSSKLVIFYQDGLIDVLSESGQVMCVPDLYMKQASMEKIPNDACVASNKIYLAMPFGIMLLNTTKGIIEDTYYIGANASNVNVSSITLFGDSLLAIAADTLYSACLQENIIDFAHWRKRVLPTSQPMGMRIHNGTICIASDTILWTNEDGKWVRHHSPRHIASLVSTESHLFAITNDHRVMEISDNFAFSDFDSYGEVNDIVADGSAFWTATVDHGIVRKMADDYTAILPDGPICNMPYRLKVFDDKLYMLRGGRWAVQYLNPGVVMNYHNGQWFNLNCGELSSMAQHTIYDVMNVAQDPADATHYFLTSYGRGLLELKDDVVTHAYMPSNSPLTSAVADEPQFFTRTDGALYDDQGYLWVLNPGGNYQVHVIDRHGKWSSFNLYKGSGQIALHTPGEIMVDRRNSQWKWIPECRSNTGLVLLQDNGTPMDHSDDKVYFRNQWFDQNTKAVTPEFIYCLAQDRDNTIWVGTSTGLFTIPSSVDYTTSNRCERIIIPRTDGSGLGDYLLGNEQINAIVVDGANRKWIGTASSGLYLMSEDGLETIEHFTTLNSLMPGNNVLSLAMVDQTGELFVGTDKGLVSYMTDATEPASSYAELYAFPNPVYPTYQGYVTIRGIMADTEVRITDASGNLVKKIQGNGGEAIWDCTNYNGSRVASGIYTALCNTTDGNHHGVVKIMIMH